MSTETTATVTVETDPVADALAAQKAAIIDVAVRTARAESWCGTFELAMAQVFPDHEGDWYDSDGFTCRGYDRYGFDRDGFNPEGYNREGYNREGFDRYGYDVNGYDRHGWDTEGRNMEGVAYDDPTHPYRYDADGYDVNGWHRTSGYDRLGYTRTQRREACRFNEHGVDVRGFDRYGVRPRD